MKVILVALFLFFSIQVIAEDDIFVYDNTTTTDRYTLDVDLKTLKRIKKERIETIEEFNKRTPFTYRIGIQQDEFESKNDIFIQSLTPSIEFAFQKKSYQWLFYDFNFQLSKNAFIPMQEVNIGYSYLFLLNQFGQKLALSEQVNSGYIFYNVGVGGYLNFWGFNMNYKILTDVANFNSNSFYIDFLKQFESDSIGIYFALENYNPINQENERQGQQTSKGGIIFKY